jgi:outer membrane lipoprotein SlyB
MSEGQRRIHPLTAVAAVAVIIFSAVGVAMMTGIMPSTSSKEAPPVAPIAATETPATKPAVPATKETAPAKHTAPVHKAEQKAPAVEPQQVAKAPEPLPAPKPAPVCTDCGVVEAVDLVKQEGQGTGLGAVAGGVAGGLIGNQFGKGTGRTVATVAGAAGGAYAGHEVEKYAKTTKHWNVRLRMDDGNMRTISQDTEPGFRAGDPVKVVDGKVVAR